MFSLEVIWRAGSAYAFIRGDGDVFNDGGLQAGEPGVLHVLDFEIDARRLSVPELIARMRAVSRRIGAVPEASSTTLTFNIKAV